MGSTVGGAGVPNGAAVIATTNGGAKWSSEVIPPAAGHLSDISCSDQRDCVAVGQAALSSNGQGVIIATVDGGRFWQSRPLPPGFLDITAIWCRSDHRCTAVGDVAGGAAALSSASATSAWVQRGMLPAGVSGTTDVSCPDDAHCWATARRSPDPDHVAGVVALTVDGGIDVERAVHTDRPRLPRRDLLSELGWWKHRSPRCNLPAHGGARAAPLPPRQGCRHPAVLRQLRRPRHLRRPRPEWPGSIAPWSGRPLPPSTRRATAVG